MNICRSKDGFIKLHYKIQDSDLWQDNNALVVFLRMVGYAHFQDNFTSIRFKGEQYHLKRGEFSATLNELSVMVNLPLGTLREVIKRLEDEGRIIKRSDNRTTVFVICNYSKYQDKPTNKATSKPAIDSANDPAIDSANATGVQKKLKKLKTIKNITTSSKRDVLGIVNRITGRNFMVEPVGIEKTKAKFSDEVIERALKNMYKDDWHKGKMKELKCDYLLRASTIDQFKDFESKTERYVIPGTTVKNVVEQPSTKLTRAQLNAQEYAS